MILEKTAIDCLRETQKDFFFKDILGTNGRIFQFLEDAEVNLNIFYLTIGNGDFVNLANGVIIGTSTIDPNTKILLSDNPFAKALDY